MALLSACVLHAPVVAQSAAPAQDATAARAPAPGFEPEPLVVRATLNTVDKGEFFVARLGGDFLLRASDLRALGLTLPAGLPEISLQGEAHVSLRSVAGLTFSFDPTSVGLALTADPALLPTQSLVDFQPRRALGRIPQETSLFFNYALTGSGGAGTSGSPLDFSSELGWRRGDLLFQSDTSTTERADGTRRLVRLQTSLTHDDRDDLRRTVIGDFFTPAREFSNGVNLGGLSISRRYGLNPYFLQYPLQNVSGNVALPSDLEVYVDGQRVRSERLSPGAFELRDILASAGSRSVQLVLRDALGREQRLDYSFYVSDQPLSQGLHEYSYNVGALRRDFGQASNQYGPAAFSMFHRYGVNDMLTVGLRADGGQGLVNAGPLATLKLGSAGVLGMAFAASSVAGLKGTAATMNYAYQSRRWSVGASLRRDSANYAELGDPNLLSNRRFEGSVTGSYSLSQGSSLSLSHASLLTRSPRLDTAERQSRALRPLALDNRRVTALNYSLPVASGRASLSVSLSHVKEKNRLTGNSSRNEFFAILSLFFDQGRSATLGLRAQPGQHTATAEYSRLQPIGEGLGYTLQAQRTQAAARGFESRANVQYNAPAAILRADLRHSRSGGAAANDYRATVAGSLASVGGSWALGRPVNEGYGIVQVGQGQGAGFSGLAGVGVEVNGQPIGKTDARGQVFVPTLGAYVDNAVTIDTTGLPIDFAVATLRQQVSPSDRGGALIRFDAVRLQAFTGVLQVRRGGELVPLELAQVRLNAPGAGDFLTGRRGEFYLENMPPGRYAARTRADGEACRFELVIPESTESFVELGTLVCATLP